MIPRRASRKGGRIGILRIMENKSNTAATASTSPATTPSSWRIKPPRNEGRIAVVTMGVKLGCETRGYTRFRKIAEMLVAAGFEVDLITSSFQHWEKAQRDKDDPSYRDKPYRIVFIDEPGYTRNLDLRRIASHRVAANNMRAYFKAHVGEYALVYAEIPPNDVARACAESAKAQHIPFVADINDLWPEAMRMAVDVPVLCDIAYHPFERDAHIVYNLLDAAVGTSDEYAARPAKDRTTPYQRLTVYVGNDLAEFDAGVEAFSKDVEKPAGDIWVTYAGTLGASYDLSTLVKAAAAIKGTCPHVKVKILGDGPDRAELEELAGKLDAPVAFLGYQDYRHMAAYLAKSDIVVNSLVKDAPQSIVTKIGDYLASGHPIINTGSSSEFRQKVVNDGFGINVPAENVDALADAITRLAHNPGERKMMGSRGRAIAEKEFDQSKSYREIVHLVESLI